MKYYIRFPINTLGKALFLFVEVDSRFNSILLSAQCVENFDSSLFFPSCLFLKLLGVNSQGWVISKNIIFVRLSHRL